MREVYKIRRKKDGLFSTGGTSPHFTKSGKIWSARNHVTSHLQVVWKKSTYYKDCEVVRIQIQETEVEATDVFEWQPSEATLRAKELKEQRLLEREKERKLQQIESLQQQINKLKNSG